MDRLSVTRLLTVGMVREARVAARERGVPLQQHLADRIGVGSSVITIALAERLAIPVADSVAMCGWQAAFDLLPYHEAVRRRCVLFRDGDRLRLAATDPFDRSDQDWLEQRLAMPIEFLLAHPDDVAIVLSRHEESARAMDSALAPQIRNEGANAQGEEISLKSISEDTSPVVRLVRSTLYDALKSGASDIHLESTPAGLTIKYRIDGVLIAIGAVPGTETAEQAISRIKVMSELDISERRIPQDGRFQAQLRGRDIDFRVSIMPSIHGEDAVLRILDKESLTTQASGLRLDSLGFDEDTMHRIRRLAAEPYGMLLVTGPTGSGKTTSLYSVLNILNKESINIITLEDPIEYYLEGVNQSQVRPEIGFNFASGLRAILRQDPNVVMVGEIRDFETAELAIHAGLTGHIVLSTLHTNDTFGAVPRLIDMKIEPFLIASTLNIIIAQRLVRKICPDCKEEDVLPKGVIKEIYAEIENIPNLEKYLPQKTEKMKFYKGKGCSNCQNRGYQGRIACT